LSCKQAAQASPILGQLYLPHDSYILSAEVARVGRQALESATWGKEFVREEEVRRRRARAVLSLLARACKGCGPLRSLVAQSNVDGLVARCSLPWGYVHGGGPPNPPAMKSS